MQEDRLCDVVHKREIESETCGDKGSAFIPGELHVPVSRRSLQMARPKIGNGEDALKPA